MAMLTIPGSATVLALIVVFTSAAGPTPPSEHHQPQASPLEARTFREVTNQQAHKLELVGHTGGSFVDLVLDGRYAYVAMGPGVVVLDVTSASRPQPVGQIDPLGNLVASLAVSGGFLYVGTADTASRGDAGLHIFDVANPATPIELGFYRPTFGREVESIALAGPHAYVMSRGLRVVDVSDPTNPVEIGFAATPLFGAVVVAGGYAYASSSFGGEPGVFIFDVSNPTSPTEVGRLPSVEEVVEVADGAAYGTARGELLVFDVSSPATPIQVGSYPAQVPNRRSGRRVRALGDQLYVIGPSAIGPNGIAHYSWDVLDVSDRASPTPLGRYETAGVPRGLAVAGSYAYIASDGPHGLQSTLEVIDISDPAAPMQVGAYSTLGAVWGMALGARHAYVISGQTRLAGAVGLTILDVTDPRRPVPVAFLELPGRPGDVAVSGNHAYVAAGPAGLHVVDVSDPARPIHVANRPAGATGVAASGRAAVITLGRGDIRVVDVFDPVQPSSRSVPLRGQVPIKLAGSHAYIAGDNGFRIVDLSAPDSPADVGSFLTPGPILALDVADGYAVIYGDFGVWIVDVSDPGSPNQAGEYPVSHSVAAVAVAGEYAYLLGRAIGGLLVLDVSSPSQPREVGFYPLPGPPDVLTALVAARDHVYVSAGQFGLFVLNPAG